MPRNYKISDVTKEPGEGILDIPYIGFLRHKRAPELIKQFKEQFGEEPKGVALSVTAPDGLLFEIPGLGDKQADLIERDRDAFRRTVREFALLGMTIYLSIDPTVRFTRTDGLHIVDLSGQGTPALCIRNERSQQYIGAILGTGIDIALEELQQIPGSKFAGAVIDCANLWPMSAKKKRIDLTCFCASCRNHYSQKHYRFMDEFRDHPSPLNLVLKDSGTGISHINEIHLDTSEVDIVRLSRQKGFTEIFDNADNTALLRHARTVRDFLIARHELTVSSLHSIFNEALDGLDVQLGYKPKRIITTEGLNYDFTSGLFLEKLDEISSDKFDEIWFDPTSFELVLRNVPFRSYLWKRGRYYIDSFLEFGASLADPVTMVTTTASRYSKEQAEEILQQRQRQVFGTAMVGKSALLALPKLWNGTENTASKRLGIVGVALDEGIADGFRADFQPTEGLREETQSENTKSRRQRLLSQLENLLSDED